MKKTEVEKTYENVALEVADLLSLIQQKLGEAASEIHKMEDEDRSVLSELADFNRSLLRGVDEHPFYLEGLGQQDIRAGLVDPDEEE